MSREIVEAVRGLAAEKNISSEKLMEALEDALLSAYKKTPDAARYAKVEMDRDSGDFKVWELKIPPELEEQLLVEATPEGYRERGRFLPTERSKEPTMTVLVLAGGKLYLRDQDILLCYDVRANRPVPAAKDQDK